MRDVVGATDLQPSSLPGKNSWTSPLVVTISTERLEPFPQATFSVLNLSVIALARVGLTARSAGDSSTPYVRPTKKHLALAPMH